MLSPKASSTGLATQPGLDQAREGQQQWQPGPSHARHTKSQILAIDAAPTHCNLSFFGMRPCIDPACAVSAQRAHFFFFCQHPLCELSESRHFIERMFV